MTGLVLYHCRFVMLLQVHELLVLLNVVVIQMLELKLSILSILVGFV